MVSLVLVGWNCHEEEPDAPPVLWACSDGLFDSSELDRDQVLAVLSSKMIEAERRRAMRREASLRFTNHRLFLRINFTEVLRSTRIKRVRNAACAGCRHRPFVFRCCGVCAPSLISVFVAALVMDF